MVGSLYSSLALSVERYLAVVHPFAKYKWVHLFSNPTVFIPVQVQVQLATLHTPGSHLLHHLQLAQVLGADHGLSYTNWDGGQQHSELLQWGQLPPLLLLPLLPLLAVTAGGHGPQVTCGTDSLPSNPVFRTSYWYLNIYVLWLNTVLNILLPILSLVVLNVIILK